MIFDMQAVDVEVQQANNTLAVAQSYVIDSPEMAEAAAEDLRDIKTRQKALEEVRLGMTRPLDESKKRIMELFDTPKRALEQAESVLKTGLLAYTKLRDEAEEKIRKEREAAAQKLADEAASAQRAAEAEATAAAEKAAAAQKAAEASGDPEAIAAAEKAAEKAAEAENDAVATAVIAASMEHMAPVVAEKTTLKGFSSRDSWKAEVTDLMALVKAVAAGDASLDLLEANTKAINQRVTALKAEFKAPGIRTFTVPVATARSSR